MTQTPENFIKAVFDAVWFWQIWGEQVALV